MAGCPVPSSKGAKGLEEQIEKVGFLKELAANRLVLPDLPLAGLEHFAQRLMSRQPAALARVNAPHRTSEASSCLPLTLLGVTAATVTLRDHGIAALGRDPRNRAEEARASR